MGDHILCRIYGMLRFLENKKMLDTLVEINNYYFCNIKLPVFHIVVNVVVL